MVEKCRTMTCNVPSRYHVCKSFNLRGGGTPLELLPWALKQDYWLCRSDTELYTMRALSRSHSFRSLLVAIKNQLQELMESAKTFLKTKPFSFFTHRSFDVTRKILYCNVCDTDFVTIIFIKDTQSVNNLHFEWKYLRFYVWNCKL